MREEDSIVTKHFAEFLNTQNVNYFNQTSEMKRQIKFLPIEIFIKSSSMIYINILS